MPKKTLNPEIANSIKTAAAGSFADNIKMIYHHLIKPHEENFYSLSEIELLAEDIARQGLKNNLVVRESADGEYVIKSGHRRHRAWGLLIEQGRAPSKLLPCYIDPQKSDDEELQDLIMLNATSRIISEADLIKQYEKLKAILEKKKANGESVRIREKTAEILGISTGKVSMIEAVVKNPEAKNAVEKGETSIFKANDELKKEKLPKKKPEPLPTLATKNELDKTIKYVTIAFERINFDEKEEILEMLIYEIKKIGG
jgi:ParB family chromosome partitioning protein